MKIIHQLSCHYPKLCSAIRPNTYWMSSEEASLTGHQVMITCHIHINICLVPKQHSFHHSLQVSFLYTDVSKAKKLDSTELQQSNTCLDTKGIYDYIIYSLPYSVCSYINPVLEYRTSFKLNLIHCFPKSAIGDILLDEQLLVSKTKG